MILDCVFLKLLHGVSLVFGEKLPLNLSAQLILYLKFKTERPQNGSETSFRDAKYQFLRIYYEFFGYSWLINAGSVTNRWLLHPKKKQRTSVSSMGCRFAGLTSWRSWTHIFFHIFGSVRTGWFRMIQPPVASTSSEAKVVVRQNFGRGKMFHPSLWAPSWWQWLGYGHFDHTSWTAQIFGPLPPKFSWFEIQKNTVTTKICWLSENHLSENLRARTCVQSQFQPSVHCFGQDRHRTMRKDASIAIPSGWSEGFIIFGENSIQRLVTDVFDARQKVARVPLMPAESDASNMSATSEVH